jgi:hypothetical protein
MTVLAKRVYCITLSCIALYRDTVTDCSAVVKYPLAFFHCSGATAARSTQIIILTKLAGLELLQFEFYRFLYPPLTVQGTTLSVEWEWVSGKTSAAPLVVWLRGSVRRTAGCGFLP